MASLAANTHFFVLVAAWACLSGEELCGALACAGEGFCTGAGADAGIGAVVGAAVGDGEVCRGVLADDACAGVAFDSAYQVWTPL